MFYLASPLKTHAFVCTNKDDKSAWVQKINQVIAELVSSNATLAGTRLFNFNMHSLFMSSNLSPKK